MIWLQSAHWAALSLPHSKQRHELSLSRVIGPPFPPLVSSWFPALVLSVTQTTCFLRHFLSQTPATTQHGPLFKPCPGSSAPTPTKYFFISHSRGCKSVVCGMTGFICSSDLLEIGKLKKKKKKKNKQEFGDFFLKEKHLRLHSLDRSHPSAEPSCSWVLVAGPLVKPGGPSSTLSSPLFP